MSLWSIFPGNKVYLVYATTTKNSFIFKKAYFEHDDHKHEAVISYFTVDGDEQKVLSFIDLDGRDHGRFLIRTINLEPRDVELNKTIDTYTPADIYDGTYGRDGSIFADAGVLAFRLYNQRDEKFDFLTVNFIFSKTRKIVSVVYVYDKDVERGESIPTTINTVGYLDCLSM